MNMKDFGFWRGVDLGGWFSQCDYSEDRLEHFITEKDLFTRVITQVKDGCVIGYKYFDFGEDDSTKTMELAIKVHGCGCKGKIHVMIDGTEVDESTCAEANLTPEDGRFAADGSEIVEYSTESARVLGKEIGVVEVGLGDGIYRGRVENVTGRHALYFKVDSGLEKGAWTSSFFNGRAICEIEEFVFLK